MHNKPQHYVFLYPFNDSIKGDANVNIEGIRRTLASLYPDTAMPRTLYVQADNASDNKNWTLMLFFAMLVYHGYTTQVFFSFLMVGHTVCKRRHIRRIFAAHLRLHDECSTLHD